MPPRNTTPKAKIVVYCDTNLRREVKAEAALQNRSLSNLVETILEEYFANKEEELDKEPESEPESEPEPTLKTKKASPRSPKKLLQT